jgi:hypothetical protein
MAEALGYGYISKANAISNLNLTAMGQCPGPNLIRFNRMNDYNIPALKILRNWQQNFIVSFSFENFTSLHLTRGQDVRNSEAIRNFVPNLAEVARSSGIIPHC